MDTTNPHSPHSNDDERPLAAELLDDLTSGADERPHQFVSISEQEWKSGKPRHLCAECDLDYSDPVHG